MNKVLSLILTLVIIASVFTACKGSTPDPAPEVPVDIAGEAPQETPAVPAVPEESGKYTTTLEDIKAKGKFVVGLDDTFAPMGFRDKDSQLVGFDIDLATAVGEYLEMEIEFQPIAWDAKEMELETGKIDCIWNGLSVTPERTEMLSMSKPYLANYIIVMTNEGVEIASKEALADFNIGVQAASAALEAIKADAAYELFADKVVEYPTYDEVIMDMQAGRLDCMVIDQVFGEYKNTRLGGIYGAASFDFGEDLYAVGFRKGDTALTESINEAFAALNESGVSGEISVKWFGEDIVLK